VAWKRGIGVCQQRGFDAFRPYGAVIPKHGRKIRCRLGATRLAFRGVTAALALGVAFGCASGPPRERSVLFGAENRIFLILPLNIAAAMPPQLAFFGPIIWEELELYLRAQDKQLKTVSRLTARKLWLKNIQQIRAGEKGNRAGFDDAARALALELGKHAEFDALIAPSLFIREAPFANRSARWDGVERPLEFEARGLEARNFAATPLEGAAPAASLHIAVFDAKGEKIHEGMGGLDLLARIRVTGTSPSGPLTFEFETRSDVFGNREDLREGIAAAFAPLLPPLPE